MRKLTCMLILTVFLISALICVGSVHAATPVSGLISSDATWTASNSPYQLSGPTAVIQGVTLTIEPGVTVDFGNYYLRVNGTLHASGTSSNKITITTDAAAQNPLQQIQLMNGSANCIVENAVLNQVSILAKGGSPKIANNVFNNPFWMAVLSSGGSPTITDNIIQGYTTEGISAGGSATVTGNLLNFTGGDATPTAIVAHDSAYVANNQILNWYNGITVDGQVTVEGNVVAGSSNIGIWVDSQAVNVESNYVTANKIGIIAEGNIQNNAVIDNEVGIQTPAASVNLTITGNNIVGNSQSSFVLKSAQNVDAANNWWGTTDIQAINQTIWDFKKDFNLGTVNFLPFLNEPNTQAPSSPNIDFKEQAPTNPTQAPTTPPDQGTVPTAAATGALSIGDSSSDSDTAGAQFNVYWIVIVVIAIVAVVSVAVFVFSVDRQRTVKQ